MSFKQRRRTSTRSWRVACWCAGLVVAQSSGDKVKSYNYKVRFDADDVAEKLWLREERYVGSSTVTAENDWAALEGCAAGSWTLFAVSVAPRGVPAAVARGGGGVPAPFALGAARAGPPPPVALRPSSARQPIAPSRAAIAAPPSPLAGLLEPVATSAPGAAAGPRLLHCWRSGCGRMFAEGQGDVDDTRACGMCEHFAQLPPV